MAQDHFDFVEAAMEAIRTGIERYLDVGGGNAQSVLTVETDRTCLGHLHLRRSVWAAYTVTGTFVGVFDTAREASAALGGRA